VVLLIKLIYFFICILLILVILVQDPRGGGLAGIFGGPGGTSAFGTKTADLFTKITVALGVAFFIIVIVLGKVATSKSIMLRTIGPPAATSEELPQAPAEEAPVEETSPPPEAPAD